MLFSHFHDIQALSSIVHPFHGFCMQIMLVFPQTNKSHQKQHITAQTGSEQCKMAKTVRDFRGLSGTFGEPPQTHCFRLNRTHFCTFAFCKRTHV